MDRLLAGHRRRLRRMVAVRMSDQLQSRVDPSDVVQETLAEAAARLEEYSQAPDAPFFLWLRQIAHQRLVDATRRHLKAAGRSVRREQSFIAPLPDQSAVKLAERLMASGTSPSKNLRRDELRQQVQAALARLSGDDREILLLRYLEQLRPGEIAEVLGISDRAFRTRHRKALDRMLELLETSGPNRSG